VYTPDAAPTGRHPGSEERSALARKAKTAPGQNGGGLSFDSTLCSAAAAPLAGARNLSETANVADEEWRHID